MMKLASRLIVLVMGAMVGSMLGGGISIFGQPGHQQQSLSFQQFSLIGALAGVFLAAFIAFRNSDK